MEIPAISHKKTRLLKKTGFFVEFLKPDDTKYGCQNPLIKPSVIKPDDTKYGCQNPLIKPSVIPAFAGIHKRFR